MTPRRRLWTGWPAMLLAGCAQPVLHGPVTAPAPAAMQVTVPAVPIAPAPAVRLRRAADAGERCPSTADIRRLRAARPKALRTQPMPASPAERVARTTAQLGLYEAQGAWADQVEDLLAKCDPG